jgi:hypothetical protein
LSKFHETKKSAAVLKHGIIDAYASPFAGKTGKWAADNRVAFIDGYAGPGRYGDAEEGSGAMLLRKAHELAGLPRNLELHFVEADPATVAKLRDVVAKEGAGVTVTVTDDDISAVLPDLLDEAAGIPLFVYLDPCGLVIPFDEVVQISPNDLAGCAHPRPRYSSTSRRCRCVGSPVTSPATRQSRPPSSGWTRCVEAIGGARPGWTTCPTGRPRSWP